MSATDRIIAGNSFSHTGPLTGPIIAPVGMSGGVWDGANFSSRRGYVYAPLQTRDELPSTSRNELVKRARWLTRNVGFAKRCVWGLARMAGWMSPVPTTQDKDWNKAAADLFERRYGSSPLSFDAQGRQNVYGYQQLITATRLQDGDFFTALTESAAGQAMVMSYEAHQFGDCGPAVDRALGLELRDGALVNRLGRIIGYRVRGDGAAWQGIDARDIVHHADFMSVGHVRGVSALHHAVTHLLDRTELIADLKTGSKIANRQAFFISNQQAQARGSAPTGMSVASGQPQIATPGQWTMQDLYNPEKRGGKIVELGAGQELKALLDSRPHPNTVEFLDYLCRDIAAGLDMAPEVLWNIAKLGGASVRYVMADAQKTVERLQQILVDQFLTRFWVYFVAKEMAAGRLPQCKDPNWYVVAWQPPAKLTVDIGREGRLSIDLHKSGMLTLSKWFGAQGGEWKEEIEQSVEEYAFKVLACQRASERYGFEIRPADVWQSMVSNALPAEPDPAIDEVDVEPVKPAQAAA